LYDGYVRRLLGLARARVGGLPRRAADSEDVALSAFKSFCRRAEQDGFAQLADSDDLWQILALLTTRKAADVVTRELATKRGGGQVRGESAFGKPGDESGAGPGIEQVLDGELSPAEVAELVEEYRALLDELGEESPARHSSSSRGPTHPRARERQRQGKRPRRTGPWTSPPGAS
jgi:hypothetical protein